MKNLLPKIFLLAVLTLLITLIPSVKPVEAVKVNATITTTNSLNSGLVGWWTFDGADVNATQVLDKSGSGNNGTRTGGVAMSRGKLGQAGKFDGSDDYLDAGSNSNFNFGTGSFTITAWIQRKVTGDYHAIATKGNFSDGFEFRVHSTNVLNFWAENSNIITGNTLISANKWYHIAITRDAGTKVYTLYVNGVSDNTATEGTLSNISVSDNLLIGVRILASVLYLPFNGSIDDARVYNRALSAKEIKQLYEMGGGKINKTPTATVNLNSGLVGWWTFDGKYTDSVSAMDSSGQENKGTITGAVVKSGKMGQAMSFDGVNDIVTLSGNSLNFQNKSEITLSVWIKRSSGGDVMQSIITNNTWGNGYMLDMGDGNPALSGSFRFVIDMAWYNYDIMTPTVTYNDGSWHHAVAVLVSNSTSSTMKIYVDGAEKSSKTFALFNITSSSNIAIIGFRPYTSYFNGKIDDVRIYNRALSAKEITQLYQQGGGKINKTPTATVNLNSGLVGWWTFDGKDTWSTTTTDKSGNGNHGGRYGGVAMSSGKLGQAGKFDGGDDYVNAGSGASIDIVTTTITAWIKPNILSGYQAIITKSDGAAAGQYELRTNGTTLEFLNSTLASKSGLKVGKWNFVVGIFDGTTVRAFIDGVGGTPVAFTGSVPSEDSLLIGARRVASPQLLFNGKIDDVRIYNRALSAKEIKQMYEMGR